MSPDFSLLLPTRGRPKSLASFFESLIATAINPDSLEVILYIDEDDDQSAAFRFPWIRSVQVRGPRVSTGEMTRRCFSASSGANVFLVNDDTLFRTPGWDVRALAATDAVKDGILLAYPNDFYYGKKLSTFPILPRRTCELLDSIVPSSYWRHGIDSHLFDVFEKLREFGHDRLVYLKDIVLDHVNHDAALQNRSSDSSDRRLYLALAHERDRLAQRLSGAITEGTPARPNFAVIPLGADLQRASMAALDARAEVVAFLSEEAKPHPLWESAALRALSDDVGVVISGRRHPRTGRDLPIDSRNDGQLDALGPSGLLIRKCDLAAWGGLKNGCVSASKLCAAARDSGRKVIVASDAVLYEWMSFEAE